LAEIVAKEPETAVFDVRKGSEYLSEHYAKASSAPLDTVNESMLEIPRDKTVYIHCAGGYRSMIFASILRARGYDNLIDVREGFKGLKDSGQFEMTDSVCATTFL
ncbi:MAG: rhodanese-like domain-containing protein, partial [Bacteroidota bacterium]